MIEPFFIHRCRMLRTRLTSFFLIQTRLESTLTNEQVLKHRARLFDQEKERQIKGIQRIEKIEVKYEDESVSTTLMMNKSLSTPHNCAMHISELVCSRSALAYVNDKPWDMHRPLEDNCSLRFVHFKDEDPVDANKAYWRSCSFLLGYLLEISFKNNFFVDLISFPPPNVQSGSFVYDAQLNIPNWKATQEELRCLSMSASKLFSKNLPFDRLDIKVALAEEIFRYNKFKLEQIPSIAQKSENKNTITVYKVGDYVDISKGPMIANTSLIGRFSVTGLFNVDSPKHNTQIQRIQGVSIPAHLHLHFWTFNQLALRASKLNDSDKNLNLLFSTQSKEQEPQQPQH